MSKVICEVCGTAYPETSTQCPICGCVRSAGAPAISQSGDENVPARKYEHVKGGRFSKENVRKRTMTSQSTPQPKAVQHAPVKQNNQSSPSKKKKKKNNGNMGLVITIFVLLLAIIAVVAYIIIKFFIPASAPVEETIPTEDVVVEDVTEFPEETEPVEILCVDLALDAYEILLENAGDHTYLEAIPNPMDTTDEVFFESADNSIAMVESDGRVTAVSRGETFITVTCGIVSTQCKVTVGKVKLELVLNRQEIAFANAGDTWTVYSGNIPMEEISWSSDDETVATVENGVVTAVGDGVTTIYGKYDGQIQSCIIRCVFATTPTEEGTPGNGSVSSDAEAETEPAATEPAATEPAPTQPTTGEYTGPFELKNLIGVSSKDVSIKVGESFILALVDSTGKQVKGVEWTVDGSACTVNGGTVKGVRSGYCEIVAKYDGQTYKCIVRVR